ncbi:hypothetical protein ACFVIM_34335 [Streptomyces sp. NPDC057638]|uniref:hypothetical protein n=1 Tax=Streptomyces sp. NPDC057638 TaxID=3346190 RepID=UPI0036BEDBD7
MTELRDVDEARGLLRAALNRCEGWLATAAGASEMPAGWPRDLGEDADVVRRLRTRAASSLINVALLGYFSSGKSFLLSGLQGGLDVIQVPTEDGDVDDKFVGLLPSSPIPTTSWPFSVVPVDSQSGVDPSGTGFLRVRFADAPPDEWEDVGDSPAPAVVEAYAMEEGDVVNRLRPHRAREVAEAELLLADAPVPAKFYDLPGVGSANTTHDAIVRRAMLDADCYLYVTPAHRTLSDDDLGLIRALYDHCLLPGQNNQPKRVVWAVTAIDLAANLDRHNQPAWKATVARNNRYLRENFQLPDGRPDLDFIGEGFIPVSPAWEASALRLAAEGAEASAHRERKKSNMDTLRQAIEHLITTGTGTRHIAAIAAEARYLFAQRYEVIAGRLQTERLEIDELRERLGLQRLRIQKLDTEVPVIRELLQRGLDDRVQRASRPFNRLGGRLHSALDGLIRVTDVSRPAKANQVQVAKAQALRAWLESPTGPVTLWTGEYDAFKQDAVRAIDRVFGDPEIAGRLPEFHFDINDVSVPQQARRNATRHDIVQRAAALVGIVTPVAASGGWMYGLAAAGTLLPPAGMVAGAAALVYLGLQYRKGRASSLDVLRQEWIQAIDTEVSAIREQFALATAVQGADVIDHLTDNLVQYREQLVDSSALIRERIDQPENLARQEVIAELEPLCAEGAELLAILRSLEALAPAG